MVKQMSRLRLLRSREFEPFDEIKKACQEFFGSKPVEWVFQSDLDAWRSVAENNQQR